MQGPGPYVFRDGQASPECEVSTVMVHTHGTRSGAIYVYGEYYCTPTDTPTPTLAHRCGRGRAFSGILYAFYRTGEG